MDITPLLPEGRQVIETYGGGRFQIAGVAYASSVLVFPRRTLTWSLDDVGALGLEDLEAVLAAADEVEILLLGCGARMVLAAPALRQALKDHGIVIDTMDTGAACRTYNVLLMEGRQVAAALIPVD